MFKKFSFFLKPQHVCVKGKRINRGVGYGLEIPAEYIFYENEKAIQWVNRTLDGVGGNVKKKVLRCLKYSLLGGNFHGDNRNRTWTFCLLMRGVRYFCPPFRGFL